MANIKNKMDRGKQVTPPPPQKQKCSGWSKVGLTLLIGTVVLGGVSVKYMESFTEFSRSTLCKVGVTKLCRAEDDWVLASRNSISTKLGALSQWLEDDCPGTMGQENIYFGMFNKGGNMVRGMGATKKLKKDSYFVCIPKKCWFGPANMPQRYKDLGTKYPNQCGTIQYTTALWMADEMRKGVESFWDKYLDSLPTREDYEQYHPAMLQSSAHSTYKKCIAEKGENGGCLPAWTGKDTSAEYYWNRWYGWLNDCRDKYLEEIQSGGWVVPENEPGRDRVLTPLSQAAVEYTYVVTMTRDFEEVGNIPLLDMPNTDNIYNAHQYWFNPAQDVFCLLNETPIQKGAEINVNYAQETKSPYKMFAQYAFALDPEVHEKGPGDTMCDGLGPDSLVHQCQNPVACNISGFAKRYCSVSYLKGLVDAENKRDLGAGASDEQDPAGEEVAREEVAREEVAREETAGDAADGDL